jgi:hypothetical protein
MTSNQQQDVRALRASEKQGQVKRRIACVTTSRAMAPANKFVHFEVYVDADCMKQEEELTEPRYSPPPPSDDDATPPSLPSLLPYDAPDPPDGWDESFREGNRLFGIANTDDESSSSAESSLFGTDSEGYRAIARQAERVEQEADRRSRFYGPYRDENNAHLTERFYGQFFLPYDVNLLHVLSELEEERMEAYHRREAIAAVAHQEQLEEQMEELAREQELAELCRVIAAHDHEAQYADGEANALEYGWHGLYDSDSDDSTA